MGVVPSDYFDVVILNSVVQYFPSSDYLDAVLRELIGKLTCSGTIFIGDVRNLTQLRLLHTSVVVSQLPAHFTVDYVRREIERRQNEENELVVDPAYFTRFAADNPAVTAVCRWKRGWADNEMTKFRYDVELCRSPMIRASRSETIPEVFWSSNLDIDQWIMSVLRSLREPFVVRLRNIPNARLAHDVSRFNALAAADKHDSVGEVRSSVVDRSLAWIHPEQLCAASERIGCELAICPSASTQENGLVDLLLCMDDKQPSQYSLITPELMGRRAFASDPVLGQLTRELTPPIRAVVTDLCRLPVSVRVVS
jgi:hypothetical protein